LNILTSLQSLTANSDRDSVDVNVVVQPATPPKFDVSPKSKSKPDDVDHPPVP